MNESMNEVKKDITNFYSELNVPAKTAALATLMVLIAGGMQISADSTDIKGFWNFDFSLYNMTGITAIVLLAVVTVLANTIPKNSSHFEKIPKLAKVAVWGSAIIYLTLIYAFYVGYQEAIDGVNEFRGVLNSFGGVGGFGQVALKAKALMSGMSADQFQYFVDLAEGKKKLIVFPAIGMLLYAGASALLGKVAKQLRQMIPVSQTDLNNNL